MELTAARPRPGGLLQRHGQRQRCKILRILSHHRHYQHGPDQPADGRLHHRVHRRPHMQPVHGLHARQAGRLVHQDLLLGGDGRRARPVFGGDPGDVQPAVRLLLADLVRGPGPELGQRSGGQPAAEVQVVALHGHQRPVRLIHPRIPGVQQAVQGRKLVPQHILRLRVRQRAISFLHVPADPEAGSAGENS